MKRRKTAVRRSIFWTVVFLSVAICPVARANEAADQFFALSAKLKPGMTRPEMEKFLGPPAEERAVSQEKRLTRSLWLHGEMGIEGYFLADKLYRITLSRRFERSVDAARAMDALTRHGVARYRSMPRFDPVQAEYYWIADALRFAFAKDGSNAVRVSTTDAR